MEKERIVVLDTNRSHYDVKGAADESMTVEELIEELRYLPGDCKVVFRNDNGYTYGYISDRDIDSEYWEPEEDEEEDLYMERPEMEHEISRWVDATEDGRIALEAVWFDDTKILWVGYDDDRAFGVQPEEGAFITFGQMDDDQVEDVWNSIQMSYAK